MISSTWNNKNSKTPHAPLFWKVGIKLESHLSLPSLKQIQGNNLNPIKEAYALNLRFKAFTLKKKNKILLTVLSGPHVHKKSREQYKIDYYRTFLLCHVESIDDYKKFLQFKTGLHERHLDQGLQITFTYSKYIHLQGYLPYF